jgi:hypothetical protein
MDTADPDMIFVGNVVHPTPVDATNIHDAPIPIALAASVADGRPLPVYPDCEQNKHPISHHVPQLVGQLDDAMK